VSLGHLISSQETNLREIGSGTRLMTSLQTVELDADARPKSVDHNSFRDHSWWLDIDDDRRQPDASSVLGQFA
jgi:hypothetical protein